MDDSSGYSRVIIGYWHARFLSGDIVRREAGFTVAVNPTLTHDRRVMILQTADGEVSWVLKPELADRLGLYQAPDLSEAGFQQRLAEAGVALHGADHLFYFTDAEKHAVRRERDGEGVRRLTSDDGDAFASFESAASEQDLDDAFVELDHWAVFGSFDQDRLVSVTSMYPWDGSHLADLGVLTLPPFRGRGHARRVVRAISRYAYEQGYEPQYRCQLDNQASIALAKAAGLTLFGTWDVVSSASTD
jgi:RimJ/RimL family protein N-acetyltransferase